MAAGDDMRHSTTRPMRMRHANPPWLSVLWTTVYLAARRRLHRLELQIILGPPGKNAVLGSCLLALAVGGTLVAGYARLGQPTPSREAAVPAHPWSGPVNVIPSP